MADEEMKPEQKGVSRREFFKGAGAFMASTALASGLPFAVDPALAEAPAKVQLRYACPLDGKSFDSFGDLKGHFLVSHPAAAAPTATKLNVNGKDYEVQVEPNWTLQKVLQFGMGLTGVKQMCDRGQCGSCTVIVDGRAVLSCTTLAIECVGKRIETVEGIAANPKWEPLFVAYAKWDAMQCGYCTPGMVVTAKALLDKNPNPTEQDVIDAFAGNICACHTYPRHPTAVVEAAKGLKVSAVLDMAKEMRGG